MANGKNFRKTGDDRLERRKKTPFSKTADQLRADSPNESEAKRCHGFYVNCEIDRLLFQLV